MAHARKKGTIISVGMLTVVLQNKYSILLYVWLTQRKTAMRGGKGGTEMGREGGRKRGRDGD